MPAPRIPPPFPPLRRLSSAASLRDEVRSSVRSRGRRKSYKLKNKVILTTKFAGPMPATMGPPPREQDLCREAAPPLAPVLSPEKPKQWRSAQREHRLLNLTYI